MLSARILSVVLVLGLAVCSVSQGRVIYVDDDADPNGDGVSWSTAYKYLQDALEASAAGDEIRVAQGVYKPDRDSSTPEGSGDRYHPFEPKADMLLKGGYAGLLGDDPNDRDWKTYRTILSGDLAGNDIEIEDPILWKSEPTRSDNTMQIILIYTGDEAADGVLLDGFEITGNSGRGPAVRVKTIDVVITNCSFYENYTEIDFGAAIGCDVYPLNLTVRGCSFIRNASRDQGGAITVGDALIEDCDFMENQTRIRGGALYLGGKTIVKNCRFIENWAGGGGGAIWLGGDNIFIIDSKFYKNQTDGAGGAIGTEGDTDVRNCIFCGNEGGVASISYCFSDRISFANCVMIGNKAVKHGGIVGREQSEISVVNCTIVGNDAPYGRFLSTYKLSTRWAPSSIDISNCIVANGDNEIWNEYGDIRVSYCSVSQSQDNCLYDPNQGIVWGAGNINEDPCFVDPGYWDSNDTPDDPNDDIYIAGDYHLKSQAGRFDPNSETWVSDDVTSPCIDAGDPNSPIMYEPFPNGGYINMGAYGGTTEASKSYFGEPVCDTIIAGDINGDGRVDLTDMAILMRHWTE